MNYSVLPPEINSLRMFTGAGSAPMLAASVAWDGLAAELAVAASSFGSVTSGLAGQSWQGAAAGVQRRAPLPESLAGTSCRGRGWADELFGVAAGD
nr:PPE domain-containing protein [Mycobacterium tuberculosis]